MTSTSVYQIPIRDYTTAFPVANASDSKIVKLSQMTFAGAKKEFEKSGNLQKTVNFSTTPIQNESSKEEKALRMGKIISFAEVTKQVSENEKPKVAKLKDTYVRQVSVSAEECERKLGVKKIETGPYTPVVEKQNDIVIHFNPEEIKNRVNTSFENAEVESNQVEVRPVAEYKINIPTAEEDETIVKLPHAERMAKMDVVDGDEEESPKIISLKDYIGNSEIEEKIEEPEEMPMLSINDLKEDENFSEMIYSDNELAELIRETEAEQRLAEEAAAAAERARKESQEAAENYKNVAAKAKEIEIERERAIEEAKKVEMQKEKALENYQTTIEAAKKQLEAKRTRAIRERELAQREYQKATEKTNQILADRVDKENHIYTLESEIPGILAQQEADKNQIVSYMDRAEEIRKMTNEIAGVSAENKTSISDGRENSFTSASIFEGTSPIDYKIA